MSTPFTVPKRTLSLFSAVIVGVAAMVGMAGNGLVVGALILLAVGDFRFAN